MGAAAPSPCVAAILCAAGAIALSGALAPRAAATGAAEAASPPHPAAPTTVESISPSDPGAHDSVVLAFVATAEPELAGVPGMAVGIMSATQGLYSDEQLLLDITQGARVAASAYSSEHPPALALRALGAAPSAGRPGERVVEGAIAGWQAALARAEDAPQLLRPGLLAAQIPGGGAAYAGITGTDDTDAIAAAGRSGRVAAVSLGAASSLLARIAALRRAHPLVVADLPAGRLGREDLSALAGGRAPGELLLVVQRARSAPGHELLWAGAAGLSGNETSVHAQHPAAARGTIDVEQSPSTSGKVDADANTELTSQTTSERGLIASVDLAPTILRHLGLQVPADMRGYPIHADGALDSAGLRALMRRLHVITARRLPALAWLLLAWALLLGVCASVPPARARPRARAWAMRAGALGVLWAPVAVLIGAAMNPSATVEYLTIALACPALGALTDRLLPWPRAPLAPAIVAVIALTVDAFAGTQLLIRSLLGPDPILGARFYGIGNELKSSLAVLVFAGVAAALYPAVRGRRAATAMAGAGIVLAVVEGSARIGAGVGGVILVSAGTALATVMLLAGALTDRRSASRRALIVLIAPVAGLVLLAALDLATTHGAGHYTGSILHARSAGDLRDVIVRRYTAAWDELHNGAMPVATAIALLAAGFGLRRRERLLAPVGGDPAWLAALSGGLAAGVVGSLVEDSGPVLLVVAVFALGCVLTYLWARPVATPRSPGRTRAARSRARTQPAEPAR